MRAFNAVAIAALLAPALAFAAAPGAPALSIQVQPRELRLAEGGRVRIRVASPDELPLVTVNTGRVEGLREVSSGIYEAEYAPPEGSDPEIAFVTAVTPSGRFGWSGITLLGARTVEVKAPHRTLVSVSVGDETYGPVPADGTNRAVLRVDVPPGVTSATHQGRRIDLDVPRRSFARVVFDRASLEAGVAAGVTVRVLATNEEGAPLARAQVKLEASEGTLSRVSEVAPGVYQATWSVVGGPLRQSKVTARVGTKPPLVATAALKRVAGAPAAVQVASDRATLVAGEGDELAVTGRVVDAVGNLTDAPATLVVNMGTGATARVLPDAVIDWQQGAEGYTGRVLVPRQRSGKQQLELKVIAQGGLVGTKVVDLVPGPPAKVTVEPEEDLYADGRARQLRVVLVDKHGNRTDSDVKAEVTATRGTVGAAYRTAAGVYVADYRPPMSSSDYADMVRARVGPLEGQTELRVRARAGAVVLGVKGGYLNGNLSISSPTGGVELGFWRPTLRTSLGIVLDVRYFSFSKSQTLSAGTVALPVASDASIVAFEPALAWRRPLARGMVWLGAGPGLTRISTSVSIPSQRDVTTSQWALTAHASVGWGLPLGPGIPFVEVKGAYKPETDSGALRGGLRTLSLNLGYRFDVL